MLSDVMNTCFALYAWWLLYHAALSNTVPFSTIQLAYLHCSLESCNRKKTIHIFIAYLLTGAIESTDCNRVEACHHNPGFQIMSLRCTTGLKIYITNVSVGKAWALCDSFFCSYQAILVDHLYFMNISNSCDGQTQCMVSATELYELSKTEPYIFDKCGNSTPLYNNWIKVEFQNDCSCKYVTL